MMRAIAAGLFCLLAGPAWSQPVDVTQPPYLASCNPNVDSSAAVYQALAVALAQNRTLRIPCRVRMDQAFAPYIFINQTPIQQPLKIDCGNSPAWDGVLSGIDTSGGGGLDLRYNGNDGVYKAKIDLRGRGVISIQNCLMSSGGTDNFPFVFSTNTTILSTNNHWSCNPVNGIANGHLNLQDAFIFGSSSPAALTDFGSASPTASFQGYGTHSRDDKFSHCRVIATFGAAANAIMFTNPAVDYSNGNQYGGAFVFTGAGGQGGSNIANVINGGFVEAYNYKYAIQLLGGNASRNTFNLAFADANIGNNHTFGSIFIDGPGGGSCGNVITMPVYMAPLLVGADGGCQKVVAP